MSFLGLGCRTENGTLCPEYIWRLGLWQDRRNGINGQLYRWSRGCEKRRPSRHPHRFSCPIAIRPDGGIQSFTLIQKCDPNNPPECFMKTPSLTRRDCFSFPSPPGTNCSTDYIHN